MRRIIVFFVFFLIIGITYKGVLLYKCHVDEYNINKEGIFNNTLIVKHQESDDKLFKFEDIYLRDDFSHFTKNEDTYLNRDQNDELISAITLSKSKQYYTMLHDGSLVFGDGGNDKLFTIKDRDKFLSDNDIHDDIDLYNYVKKHYYLSSNIFDSIKKIKENYMINSFVMAVGLYSDEENTTTMTLIDGDIKGYIININVLIKEIHILHNDDQYSLLLFGKDFVSDNYIKLLLESIKFA